MNNYSKILKEAYEQFLLPLGRKRVPTPYRMNDLGSLQKLGPEFQGKSSPEVLVKTTKKLAKEQNFDLNKATVSEIRDFMVKNKLGIDCSGFIYRVLNHLVQKIKGKPLTAFGFDHVGRTNVVKLTSNKMSIKISTFKDAKPGDIIRLRLTDNPGILHSVLILENQSDTMIYIHSSEKSDPQGVHVAQMERGKFPEDLKTFSYDENKGDGIRRLKILTAS